MIKKEYGNFEQVRRENEIVRFAADKHYIMYDLRGQKMFAIQAPSGGILSAYIVYFKKDDGRPFPDGDLGRQGNTPIDIFAAEISSNLPADDIYAYLERTVKL